MPIVELYEHAADSKSKSRRRVALAPMISCHPAPRALHAGETDDEYRTSLGEYGVGDFVTACAHAFSEALHGASDTGRR